MAQRSRRNIASSVRGLARSRRAGKPGAKSDPDTQAPDTQASDGTSPDEAAPEEDSAAPAAAPPEEAASSANENGGDSAETADGASGGGAKKQAKRTSAAKSPAKKVLAKKPAGRKADADDSAATNTATTNAATTNTAITNGRAATAKTASNGGSADGKAGTGNGNGRAGRTGAAADGKAATAGKTATAGKATTNGKAATTGKATAGKATNGKAPAGTATTDGKATADDNTPTTELPAVTDGEAPAKAIPEAAVGRMAVYLRVLSSMQEQGTATVSSEELSAAAGVNSAKLRKDLSYIGSYGTRGVGYEVEVLIGQIERTLGLNKQQRVAVAGIGNLGHALANYGGFPGRGFPVEALFDIDPDLIGIPVGGLPVSHLDDIPEVCAEREISIGVIATPPTAAQTVCDRLVAGGVQCILNFAPVVLQVPDHIEVRKVDLAVELQILSFHVARRADGQVNGQAAGAEATDAASAVVPS
ncbi:NADH/NAD ratio-sensing transcriptional regulator Rex [Prauserella aidingensis]|nr:NADH/NAD ratio-sensing transcriptional regulator Rex [Prauserella aidingensis]